MSVLNDIRDHLRAIEKLLDFLEPPDPPANVTPIKRDDEVELEGIIGRPEFKEIRGKSLFTAGLGVSEGNITQWHNLAAWGKVAETASTLTRGQLVRVVAKPKEVSYLDSNGVMREKRELTASLITPVVHASSASS